MSLLGGENIRLLQKLFKADDDGSSSDDEPTAQDVPQLGTQPNPEPSTLEQWEAQQLHQDRALFDSRKQPDYRISYRQTVATEDIYLQMNCKTPATASCESMVVEVFLTAEDDSVGIHQIELEVQEQRVTVGSPRYRLELTLPHRINPDRGNAAWLSDQKTLRLTLVMVRELDFVNF
uniref:PIH1_CS domain-containing protein n=1 Tax=Anopheles quadriannulatus TaxID=34691 RepID=A0A182X2Y0_ANOQN